MIHHSRAVDLPGARGLGYRLALDVLGDEVEDLIGIKSTLVSNPISGTHGEIGVTVRFIFRRGNSLTWGDRV